jgi:hypothetical protein
MTPRDWLDPDPLTVTPTATEDEPPWEWDSGVVIVAMLFAIVAIVGIVLLAWHPWARP